VNTLPELHRARAAHGSCALHVDRPERMEIARPERGAEETTARKWFHKSLAAKQIPDPPGTVGNRHIGCS
jgi:hypothetical protein